MIVLDYVKEIKKNTSSVSNFTEAIQEAKNNHIKDEETIINHFESIDIKEKDSFIHLKYNNKKMFKQPWDAFYLATRAIVIDWVEEEIVLYPFDKFFELDEHKSSSLKEVKKRIKDGKFIEITEKIDGSLIVARYYKGEFLVVSSGALEGPHVDIAKNILSTDTALSSFIKKHPNHTFMLEMKNSQIPQLIKYGEDKLTIIGMRDMNNYHLLSREEISELAKNGNVSIAPKFNLTVDEMLKIMEDPNAANIEGYVLRIDDFLVKMKTKNFIFANRFAGEPSRNFNMIVEAINEGRIESIRPMIKSEFLESFDISVGALKKYADDKENKIKECFQQLDKNLDMADFVIEVQRRFHPFVKDLIAMKNNRYNRLSKDDIKYLKQFAPFFTCVSHFKYTQLNELELSDVVKDIENGKIKFLKKFHDYYNNVDIYIIHKWQWLDFESIQPFQSNNEKVKG